MTVLCIQLNEPDPYFNLATEEYLLKQFHDDIFMLWRSDYSVVVGKHQNALAEINHRYVRENNIKIARRLSGGGTVFHDPGNLNFTFIKNVERLEEVNFKIFTRPVLAVLRKLGLDAYTTGRNDLLIDGKKISGNAEHVYKNRVLHHGTLLFDSHLEKLKKALNVDLSRFEDKAVQSYRSPVTNIADYLSPRMKVEEFAAFVFETIAQSYADPIIKELNQDDRKAIRELRDEKYAQWDWIYGYSPRYKYRNELTSGRGKIAFTLQVEKGKIKESLWEGAILSDLAGLVARELKGLNHSLEDLDPALSALKEELAREGISPTDLLDAIL
ncbi:lipoate--protein ligase [Gaoshiqia sp. Z1-71]|uniref:lipoate--protein ligase n=1 Tax=Gaoshiqia hydrogeniformans TaxID=3290090 RepID=UPI003BF856EC